MLYRSLLYLAFLVIGLALLSFSGCSGSSGNEASAGNGDASAPAGPTMDSVAGTYELDKAKMKEALKAEQEALANDPDADPMQSMGLQMAAGFIDSMTMSMTLNADGSATSAMAMMGETESGSGSWTLDGTTISITMAVGDEEPKTITGIVKGNTLELKDPEAGEEGNPMDVLVFRRGAGSGE